MSTATHICVTNIYQEVLDNAAHRFLWKVVRNHKLIHHSKSRLSKLSEIHFIVLEEVQPWCFFQWSTHLSGAPHTLSPEEMPSEVNFVMGLSALFHLFPFFKGKKKSHLVCENYHLISLKSETSRIKQTFTIWHNRWEFNTLKESAYLFYHSQSPAILSSFQKK